MKKIISCLSETEIIEKLKTRPQIKGPVWVYSSLLEGWTDSPLGSLIGLDDHGFHRGDGLFEAVRICHGKPYLLAAHFRRMQQSAEALKLKLPLAFRELEEILNFGLQNFPHPNAMTRIFMTRGPGGFSTSPRESLGAQFFVVILPFVPLSEDLYRSGVSVGKSQVPTKSSWLARAKTLNYLPNVMMKLESLEQDLHFTVGFDEQGGVAESSTENIVILNREGVLCYPQLNSILKGCTMDRAFELAEKTNLVAVRRGVRITESDLLQAKAVMMMGTTLDVLPVSRYQSQSYQDFTLAHQLRALIQQDQSQS